MQLPVFFTDFEPESDKTFLEETDETLKNFLNLDIRGKQDISKHLTIIQTYS